MTAAALFALLWAAGAAALRRRTRLRAEECALGGGVLACAWGTTSAALLGAAEMLAPAPARWSAAAGILAAAAAAGLPSARRAGGPAPWSLPAALAGAAVLLAAAFRVQLAAALPLDSWDGLSYHAPILWRWLQQGNLDLAGWPGPQRWFPWNGELLPAWLCLLEGGSWLPVKLGQLPGLLLLAASGASLGRRLAGPAWAGPLAAAMGGLPIALIHAGLPYVDLLHAAYWAASAALALSFDRGGSRSALRLWALAWGLALGTKATLYFMAPPVLQLLAAARRPSRRAFLLRESPLLLALALPTGLWCYLRNWLETGSPIYPYAFRLAGRTLFPGPMEPTGLLVTVERWFVASKAGWLLYPFRETMKGAVAYSSENGFGPLFCAGWLLWPAAAWRAARGRDAAAAAFLALLPATAFFFLAMHPTREPRYVVFLAPVVAGAAAYALGGLRGGPRLAAQAAWAAGVLVGLAGTAAYFGSDAGLRRAAAALRRGESVDAFEHYRSQYGALGEAWAFLDRRLVPGDAVAVNYGELLFPWAGVPPRARLVGVGHSPNDLRDTLWTEDSRAWLDMLDSQGVRYYALWTPDWYPDVGRRERESIAAFPRRFTSLGRWKSPGIGDVELFELQPEA